MALLEDLQIYIPEEADVRRVPLHSLPSSVLRKMGLTLELPDPSDCIWICPALFQGRGPKKNPQDQGKARQHMLTVLGNGQGSTHWKMSFVTANYTAYRALKDTLPVDTNTQPCSTARFPQGPPSNTEQDAVIIYHGRIYLSMKSKRQELSRLCRSTDRSQMAPVMDNQLKRKVEPPHDMAEMPKAKLSKCGPRGACHDLRASPGVSQQAAQSQGTDPASREANRGSKQRYGTTVGASVGDSRDLEPSEEPSDQSSSQASYLLQSPPHSPTLCWAPSDLLTLPNWGPSEPSAQQQDFEYQELQTRERITQMKAKLRKMQGSTYEPPATAH